MGDTEVAHEVDSSEQERIDKENYNDAIESYYQLKRDYDAQYKKKKNKIKQRDISLKEKQIRLRKLKIRCIGCKNKGGTEFTNNNGILKAICGHKAAPCRLHIEIKKSDWRYLPTVIQHVKGMVNKVKGDIIETKLDFLFGLKAETSTVQLFEGLKKNFEDAYSLLSSLEETMELAYSSQQRKMTIKEYRLKLHLLNEEFAGALDEYKRTEQQSFLVDAIRIYKKQILRLEKRIQHEKYAYMLVDKEDSGGFIILDNERPYKYILQTPINATQQKEHEWDSGTVIRNLK